MRQRYIRTAFSDTPDGQGFSQKPTVRRRAEHVRHSAGRGSNVPTTTRTSSGCRGSVQIEHTLAKRGAEKLWNLLHDRPYVAALGASTGNQAVQQVRAGPGGDLPVRLAGRRRREPRPPDVPRPGPVPGQQRPRGGRGHQRRAAARRPDRPRRRQGRDRLARPDRRRHGGRLRRPPQRLRAHQGDDRGGRRRRAPRGPARVREEVRPHGRQGAAADLLAHPQPRRRPPRRGRLRHLDADHRPHRRRRGRHADLRRRRARPRVPHRRAHRRGLLPHQRRASSRRSRAASPTRPTADLVWCETSEPDIEQAERFAKELHDAHPGKLLAYNCSPSFNWKGKLDDDEIAVASRPSWASSATRSSSSRSPASTRSTTRCSSSPAATASTA